MGNPSAQHVPCVGGDGTSRTDHAGHLGNTLGGFRNKEDDQSHDGGIKSVVGEWKCHRVALAKFRDLCGVAFAGELYLLRRRINSLNFSRPAAFDQQFGECPVSATDI